MSFFGGCRWAFNSPLGHSCRFFNFYFTFTENKQIPIFFFYISNLTHFLSWTGCSADWSLLNVLRYRFRMSEDCEWSALSSLGQMLRLTRRAAIAYRTKRFEFRSLCKEPDWVAPPLHTTCEDYPSKSSAAAEKKKKQTCLHALKSSRAVRFLFSHLKPTKGYLRSVKPLGRQR